MYPKPEEGSEPPQPQDALRVVDFTLSSGNGTQTAIFPSIIEETKKITKSMWSQRHLVLIIKLRKVFIGKPHWIAAKDMGNTAILTQLGFEGLLPILLAREEEFIRAKKMIMLGLIPILKPIDAF